MLRDIISPVTTAAAGIFAIGLTIFPAQAQFTNITPTITRSTTTIVQDNIRSGYISALPTLNIRSSAGAVGAFTVSPKGTFFASAPADGRVRLWDMINGNEIRQLDAGNVSAVAISADDNYLAAAANGGIKIWSLADGKQLHSVSGHEGGVTALSFNSDSNALLSGGQDGVIMQWDLQSGQVARRFTGHEAAIRGLAVFGNALVSGSADGQMFIWNFSTGQSSVAFGPIDKDEKLTSLAISPNGAFVASGSENGNIRLWDLDGKHVNELGEIDGPVRRLSFNGTASRLASIGDGNSPVLWNVAEREKIVALEGHTDGLVGVAFELRHDHILSASKDGMVRLWNPETGIPMARIISTTAGWAVVDEKGRFDGSLSAARDIAWSGDQDQVEMDRLTERFYQAGLLAMLVEPESRQALANAAEKKAEMAQNEAPKPLGTDRALPPPSADVLKASLNGVPKVKLLNPENGSIVSNDVIEVAVQVVDEGSGVDEIRLFHNERVVTQVGNRAATLTERSGAKRLIHVFEISLAGGENRIEAVAFSADRVESKAAKSTVTLEGPPKKPTLHVLAIGINKYKNPALNLNYGVADAEGVLNVFKTQKGSMYEKVNLIGLFNENATRDGIVGKIRSLRESDPNDVIVVYLAGHGEITEDGTWYFLPHEVLYPEREEQLKKLGLSSAALQDEIAKVGGRKVILLIDSCKSGGALLAFRGFEERKALRQLSRSTGVHIVAAAAQDQFAGEVARLNHGVFTYVVLEALKGMADGAPNDGVVSVREMLSYVENKMPEVSRKERSKAQYPVVNSRGMDFPVSAMN